jgi:hypothetical protein
MQIGDKVKYCKAEATIIEMDKTHVVVQFENGSKICTNKLTFATGEFPPKKTN